MAYEFIQENQEIFGLRWFFRRMKIYPNAYYNFLKDRKSQQRVQKEKALAQMSEIYHAHNGVDGYRSVQIFLKRVGIEISAQTTHKYMNVELGLHSIVRKKRPGYAKGTSPPQDIPQFNTAELSSR